MKIYREGKTIVMQLGSCTGYMTPEQAFAMADLLRSAAMVAPVEKPDGPVVKSGPRHRA